MPKALFEPIAVGDLRPIVVEVTPSDNAAVTSASYKIVRRNDPLGVIWNLGGPCRLERVTCGYRLATPIFILFPTVDQYTVQFAIVWDDGQLDNSVSAIVPVLALPN
jgi:hypothetical protein